KISFISSFCSSFVKTGSPEGSGLFKFHHWGGCFVVSAAKMKRRNVNATAAW
ncbi:hypothetical protein A2U01_0039491, partial [Trifolium medium]|nr:hypothetical protein [Trifolium medium]